MRERIFAEEEARKASTAPPEATDWKRRKARETLTIMMAEKDMKGLKNTDRKGMFPK